MRPRARGGASELFLVCDKIIRMRRAASMTMAQEQAMAQC